MKRSALVLGISVAACSLVMLGERDAKACGGCFHPPAQTASDITDERMLLSVSTQQTTLYDQIRYSGDPASFAWVLPIHGTVDVGLSADVLFDSVDVLTQTTINQPPQNCPGPPTDCESDSFGGAAGLASDAGAASPGSVTVTKQQNVGPYETVQLHATDSSALNNWLSTNGFSIPADVTPVIDAYVAEGFDFLAMKLLPDSGVTSMRPVRVTSPGASLSLPLRMAAIGTGATVGITIWVVADGRYEPQNFPYFRIEDKDLVWDFSTSASNYTTLRAQNESNLQGKGWEMESSLTLNQSLVSGVILSGGQYYGGGGFGGGSTASASDDYLPVPGADDGGVAPDGGATGETADQVRDDDITALFAGMSGPNVRITRMRSDISHAAMTTDFVLGASADQSELSNVRNVTQSVNLSCPIYDNCQVVGYGPPGATAPSMQGGGCTTAAKSSDAQNVQLGIFVGILGLTIMRRGRNRRRSSQK